MTLELVPWRGARVPLLNRDEISRYTTQDYINWLTSNQRYMAGAPMPVTTYGSRPAEPISTSFEGFVQGMLYADGPVAAVEAYRLRVFGQAPLLYQELVDGHAGDMFDDPALDRLREPWPGGNLSDLMKRALVYGDFAGNAFIVDLDDELVLIRPDWVEIVLAKREFRGGQVGWKQIGIVYYEGGLRSNDGVSFLPGEYAHFVPGVPDPLATYRGMSWLTPLVREVQADKAASDHKVAFFENAASPNLAVSLPKEITPSQFQEFVDKMDAEHRGAFNAYKTLYTAGGADVTVIGANMQQMDFSSVQGKGETRVANAGGVPPTLLSFSEGMQGSSLNAGNYTAAKRNFVDTTMRDLWQNFAGSVQKMEAFRPPREKSRLWYLAKDIPFMHEDAQDIASIQQIQASTVNSYITAGFKPDTAVLAVAHDDVTLLQHTGLTSVQLMPPGSQDANGDGVPDGEAQASDEYQQALDEFRAEFWDGDDEIERRAPYPGQRYRHGWIPVAGDALGLSGRIDLADGESLAGSDFIESDTGDLLAAWTDGPAGRRLRLGLGIADEDRHRWRAANLGSTVILDEAGRTRLRTALDEMRTAATREVAAAKAAVRKAGVIEDRRAVILGRQYGLNKADSGELAKIDEEIAYLDDLIPRLRAEQEDRQRRLDVEKDAAEARFLRGMVSLRQGQLDGHESRRQQLTRRRAVLTASPMPLGADDRAALTRLDGELAETWAEFWRHADSEAATGSIGGEWGAIQYSASIGDGDDLSATFKLRYSGDETSDGVSLDRAGLGKLEKLLDTVRSDSTERSRQPVDIDEIERRDYYDVRDFRGRFRKISDQIGHALNEWLKGDGGDDPLEPFTREQLRKAALEFGITPRRGASSDEIKLALLKDARQRFRGDAGADKPRASFTLKGPDHHDLDVGVYSEKSGKVSLYREKNGQRGTKLQTFDDLGALESWATEHGETDLAGWARKEGGTPAASGKAAPSKAPAKRAPATPDDLADLIQNPGDRGAVVRILDGSYTEGGRRLDGTTAKVDAIRRVAAVSVKIAKDRHRSVPTPDSKRRLDAAEADAVRILAVATALKKAPTAPHGGPVPARAVLRPGATGSSSTWRVAAVEGLPTLVPGAASAISAYLRHPASINDRLRTPSTFDGDAATADRHIAAIDRVMDQSTLDRPLTLYRGTSTQDIAGLPAGSAVGHEWTDAGYASTSTKRAVAEHSFAGRGRVLLTVRAPEGTPALQIDGLGETEVLVGRGQTFRVVADHGLTPEGARHLEVELTPAPASPRKAPASRDFQSRYTAAASVRDVADATPGSPRDPSWFTDEDNDGLGEYEAAGQEINEFLRADGRAKVLPRQARLERAVAEIDAAMDRSRLTRDVGVWRGVYGLSEMFGRDGDLTGVEWTDKAYVSTTVDESTADHFARFNGEAGDQAVMRVLVPAGTPAITISEPKPDGLGEVALGRGLRFRVVADHGPDENGVRRLDVEVVSDVASAPDNAAPRKAPAKAARKAAPAKKVDDPSTSAALRRITDSDLRAAAERILSGQGSLGHTFDDKVRGSNRTDTPAKMATAIRRIAETRLRTDETRWRENPTTENRSRLRRTETQVQRLRELADLLLAAGTSRPSSERLDLEQSARDRQAKLDRVRGVAEVLSEVDELLASGASPQALKARINSRAKADGTPPDVRDRLLEALSISPADLRDTVERERTSAGLTRVGTVGDVSVYDRRLHEPIGGASIPDGARVEVVRPGHTVVVDGREVTVSKAGVLVAADIGPKGTGREGFTAADVERENKIRQAYRDIVAERGKAPGTDQWVNMADLRERAGLSRGEFDAGIRKLAVGRYNDPTGPRASPVANTEALRKRDLEAGVPLGDPSAPGREQQDAVQALSFVDPSPLPEVAPAPKPAKAAPADLSPLDTEARRDALDLRKVDELKAMLRERGLPVSGRKRELVDRLVEHDAAPSPPTPGRDISGEVDFETLPVEYNPTTHQDDALREILRRQGFDSQPTVVSATDFDAAVRRGEVRETWRGLDTSRSSSDLTPTQMAEAYRTGDLYAGTGINGNGTYVALRRADGEYYGPTLLRIGLRRDARVISADDLDAEMDAYFAAAPELTQQHRFRERDLLESLAKARTPRQRANIRRQYRADVYGSDRRSRTLAIQRDPGRFAALRGYDAIEIPKERSPDKHAEIIILNRGATIVEAAQ